jgi:hypothetical protein
MSLSTFFSNTVNDSFTEYTETGEENLEVGTVPATSCLNFQIRVPAVYLHCSQATLFHKHFFGKLENATFTKAFPS